MGERDAGGGPVRSQGGRALQIEQRRLRLAIGLRLRSGQHLRNPIRRGRVGQLALQLAGAVLVALLLRVERLDLHALELRELAGEVLRELHEDEAVGAAHRPAEPGQREREFRLGGYRLAERLGATRGVEIEHRGAPFLEEADRLRGGGCDGDRTGDGSRGKDDRAKMQHPALLQANLTGVTSY